jgi:hypothetical protein
VRAVPAIEGIAFRLDGQRFLTDADGIARTAVASTGTHQLEAPAHKVLVADEKRADFSMWSDGTTSLERTISVDSAIELTAGYDIAFVVAQSILDSAGRPVEAGALDSISVVSEPGGRALLPASTPGLRGPTAPLWQRYPTGARWLVAQHAVPGDAFVEVQDITYSVDGVIVGGRRLRANSEAFDPSTLEPWAIKVAAYGVTFDTHNLLLGSPTPQLSIIASNGRSIEARDRQRVLLPHGSYVARAKGGGVPLDARFSLPGTARVTARVIGALDLIAALFLVGAALAAVLLRRSKFRTDTAQWRSPRRAVSGTPARVRRGQPEPAAPAEQPLSRLRVHLRSGRTIEGRLDGTPERDVMLLSVDVVRNSNGREVPITPLDSFVIRSQIVRVENLDGGGNSHPELRLVEERSRVDAAEDVDRSVS